MKVISFSCRGLASPDKKVALRRLLRKESGNLVLIQETLGADTIITPLLKSMLPSWWLHALDVNDQSGSIALGYNPRSMKMLRAWECRGFLGADIYSSKFGVEIRMLNIYGSCHHRENFWERMLGTKIFQADNLIIGGDLNFSLGFLES